MKKILIGIIVLITFTIFSCDKEDITSRPMSQSEIWTCYNQIDWNDNKIRDELIGKWKWIYTESYWAPEKGRNTENENTQIEFFNDSTLHVLVGGEIKNTTKWTFIPKDGELYGLELDSSVSQLYGRILICGEIIEFNNSYIDGSDNYFERIE